MGAGERFTEQQLQQIIDAVQARPILAPPSPPHPCRFDDKEAKAMHGLADALENGGLDNFRMLLEFGATLRAIRKWGMAAMVTVIVGAFLAALWAGIIAKIKGGS